jgi:drug/metabolite transporter (DMT)-like permease
MSDFRENARGILAMNASMLAFIFNDTLVKLAGETLPIGEILFLRSLIAVALIGGMVLGAGQHREIRRLFHRTTGWRSVGEVGATLFYLTALFRMPIANATTIMQTIPLTTVAAAAWILGERVGWRSWTAIAIGFAGVLIVVRPGLAGFDAHSFLVLVAVAFVTLRDLSTRAMPPGVPILLLTLATSVLVGLVGLALAVFEDWSWPSTRVWMLLGGSAIALTAAYNTIVVAMRHGEIGVVAPFRYTVIVWAIVLGYFVWGDRPDPFMIAGTAIIIATGIYTFHRQRASARRRLRVSQ